MDIRAPLVAEGQASEAVEPRQGTLDDPAQHAEAAAVRATGLGDDGDDALGRESGVSGRGPVGAIALNYLGLPAGAAPPPRDGRQRGDHRFELRHVVDVGRGELGDQWNTAGVRDEVVFRALLTAIGWVRSRFFPPRSARREALSITVHR